MFLYFNEKTKKRMKVKKENTFEMKDPLIVVGFIKI